MIGLGLWDEYGRITPLQLTVAMSLALSVNEEHVHAQHVGNHFFDLRVASDRSWLLSEMTDDSFVLVLNEEAMRFGARMVVSRPPTALEDAEENRTRTVVGT